MALSATILKVGLELSDVDRGVYQTLDLRVAQHPSEDENRVVLRLLALGLLHEEDLAFGRGVSVAEEPALWVTGPGDAVKLWVDVGKPLAARLHKASKRAERVAVVTDLDLPLLRRAWQGERIHRAEALEVIRLPAALVRELSEGLGRKVQWTMTVMDGQLTVVHGEAMVTGEIERTTMEQLLA